jgi:hypothetical protein
MNLINTSGLALIGPGSEWFWSMAQFVVVTATLVAIYRQLKAQGAANALGKLQFLEDRWNADRMSYARLTTALSLKTGLARPAPCLDGRSLRTSQPDVCQPSHVMTRVLEVP